MCPSLEAPGGVLAAGDGLRTFMYTVTVDSTVQESSTKWHDGGSITKAPGGVLAAEESSTKWHDSGSRYC
jgi:hypothetical protein